MLITVRLIKPLKDTIISYEGTVLQRSATHILLVARWIRKELDIGYITFSPGDYLYEHFYTDRWYNIYEVQSSEGELKGWYCNITRPAIFDDTTIESEDLELDMFVPPDRQNILVLDEDEYADRGIETNEPATHQAAMAALDELRRLAMAGKEPFQHHPNRAHTSGTREDSGGKHHG